LSDPRVFKAHENIWRPPGDKKKAKQEAPSPERLIMFAKANRLKKTADFKKIFINGKFVRGELSDLRFLPNNLANCRFGFVTGLGVSKKATIRNRIRRHLSEAAKTSALSLPKNFDILIVAKAKIVGKSREEILKDVENIFRKVKTYS
jgi:ribonuclease P protein component